MKHPLCTATGGRSASSEAEFDTTCVRSLPTQVTENTRFSRRVADTPRIPPSIVGLGLALLTSIVAGGFRHADFAVTDPGLKTARNSFHAAETGAQNLGSSQRIQACMAGEGLVCNALGVEIIQREGFSGPNANAARVSFERACSAGNFIGCNNLGVVYENTNGQELGEDLDAKAAQLFRRACEGGSSDGCSNLGVMHENGWGTPQSFARALDLYSRACEAGNALGCSNLGALYSEGKGVKRDLARAETLFDRACNANSTVGCRNLATVVERAEAAR